MHFITYFGRSLGLKNLFLEFANSSRFTDTPVRGSLNTHLLTTYHLLTTSMKCYMLLLFSSYDPANPFVIRYTWCSGDRLGK